MKRHPISSLIGQQVKMSSAWCRSTGQVAGPVPHAIGTITGIAWDHRTAKGISGTVAVVVDWDRDGPAPRVLIQNICLRSKLAGWGIDGGINPDRFAMA